MTLVAGPLLPFLALAVPVLLAGVATLLPVRAKALRLLPLAPLPALLLALSGLPQGETAAPDLLLGVTLGLDGNGRLLLGMAAFLWLAAGIYAQRYMRGTRRPGVLAAFWCLTLAGNLGVFLARDVATFYVAFSAVSLAAWVLVVHEETGRALRAGRIYIVLAIAGETALLFGILIAASATGSLAIADVRDALGEGFPGSGAALVLMVAGLGVKAGLVPLHVWLPLAHPEAPTPASAVLSGAIVKAGIFGLITLLPGGGAAGLSAVLVWAGVATAWFGIALGLTQRGAKAILAYSTVSQMGIVIAVAALSLAAADALAVDAAATFYAAHHGLAKGALFLGVGVVLAAGGRAILPVAVVTGLVAASVAGFPLTGGSAAKAAIKAPFGDAVAGKLVAWSAVGTALLLIHFLATVLSERKARAPQGVPSAWLVVPWCATAAAALVLPFVVVGTTGLAAPALLEPAALWSSFWPVGAAGLVALAAFIAGARVPGLPPGDLVLVAERVARRPFRLRARARAGKAAAKRPLRTGRSILARALSDPAAIERRLGSWSVAGLAAVVAVLLLA